MDPTMSAADEIYVDTRDDDAATAMLGCVAPTIAVPSKQADPRLGLTRWQLPDVEAVLIAAGAAPTRTDCEFDDGRHRQLTTLDDLISALRAHAACHFRGWYPLIDRNHDVGTVRTNPHVKIAGPIPPEPVPAPQPPVRALYPDGPRVGIADARVFAHEELAGHIVGDPVTGGGPFHGAGPGHATFVAGTVLRRASSAVLVCRTVLAHDESSSSWDVATRLMPFLDQDIDILNMSFGCLVDSAPPLPLRRAMDRLGARAVLVAAAGNHGEDLEGPDGPLYPAAFGDVVAAGAAEADGRPAATTPDAPWIDLLAPGENVIGPFLRGDVTLDPDPTSSDEPIDFHTGYARWSGSSFAAAAVTGTIAQLMHSRRIDAFAARDLLIAHGQGDITPFRYRRDPVRGGSSRS
jgi:membrane-anchored mycosin MYCP